MPTTRRSIADEDRADISAQALLERIENPNKTLSATIKSIRREEETSRVASSKFELEHHRKRSLKPPQKPKPKRRTQKPLGAEEAEKLAKAAANSYKKDVDVFSLVEGIENSENSQ
ncbi:hypothetical protein QAD02_020338 [Eretmocerus hayati]|uniref:Uncharacterized protein n=1 Tax=Eretmocerus hayati TaxID=131215 RepID=A0ACC2PM33_9HYME|nr:hypothetical protein QAD02_020338 [Eretmocerus hayati]